jgi:DNA-binding HxlR family transcriptional regulator
MDGGSATGVVDGMRAGARVLTILANPLNVRILRAHDGEPLRATELNERTGWPAQTTLRAAVGNLREAGLLGRREVSRMPLGVATELTPAGREVLRAADVVERWLAKSPDGAMPLDSDRAKGAVKALAAGWNTRMVRSLAHEPASLTELAQRIPEVSYPSLERRFTRMRTTHQIEPSAAAGRGSPFTVTPWLRHAIAPLCATARCERLYLRDESAPITQVEIESAFLLAMPIAPLPESANGTCILSVLPEADEKGRGRDDLAPAGVTIEVEAGTVVRCVPEIDKKTPVWALGTPMDWLSAVIDGHFEGLRFGDARPQLAADLVNGLHLVLFGD